MLPTFHITFTASEQYSQSHHGRTRCQLETRPLTKADAETAIRGLVVNDLLNGEAGGWKRERDRSAPPFEARPWNASEDEA